MYTQSYMFDDYVVVVVVTLTVSRRRQVEQ